MASRARSRGQGAFDSSLESHHKALVDYALHKEASKPSRLRAAAGAAGLQRAPPGSAPQSPAAAARPLDAGPRPGSSGLTSAPLRSNSSPSLASPATPLFPRSPGGLSEDGAGRPNLRAPPPKLDSLFDTRAPSSAGNTPQAGRSPSAETGGFRAFYPHPSSHRGTLKLSAPAQAELGIDPIYFNVEHQCSFHAKKHVYHDDHRPRTPPKSLKWRSQEHWDNAVHHSPLKVGHVAPSPKGSTLTTEMLTHCPHTAFRSHGARLGR